MGSGLPIKKILKTALYSSIILIGILAIAPHVIILKAFSLSEFFKGLLSLALLIFFIWSINIALVYLAEKYSKARYSGYQRYALSYTICFASIFFSRHLINSMVHNPSRESAHLYAVFILVFILNTIILIMQDLILLRQKKSTIEQENTELKLKNAEATNQQLKQQIHPHFLFNSLSTLKTLIKKDTTQAEEYLVKLSDFLRASLLSTTPNTIKVAEEIKLCLDYLEMQKMRFGRALQYDIDISPEIQHAVFVPVFSLLSLLENAIKHNRLTHELPLSIQIKFSNGRISVINNIQSRLASETSIGSGLENLAGRYRILSGDEVIIINDGITFSVSIKTLAHEDSNNRG